MITKVQNTLIQQPTFTAKWPDARKVIASLPEQHDFFGALRYTQEGKVLSTKKVLLERLDKAAEEVKHRANSSETFNLDMPNFSNIFKNPKKFWFGLIEQDHLNHFEKPYRVDSDDLFEKGIRKISSNTYQKGSLAEVANYLLYHGKALVKELKKAGLENPKEIEM
jgi:hypothetical protein